MQKMQKISWIKVAVFALWVSLVCAAYIFLGYRYVHEHTLSFASCFFAALLLANAGMTAWNWIKATALSKRAERGDREALYLLGSSPSPYTHAYKLDCLRNAAAQGHMEAQYRMGLLYEMGLRVPQDAEQARKWLQKAAKQGHKEAQEKLAELKK